MAERRRAWRALVAAIGTASLPLLVALVLVADDLIEGAVLPGGVNVVLLAGLTWTTWRLVRSLTRQLAGLRRINSAEDVVETAVIDGRRVRVIAGERPMAYCRGLLRPRIVVSQGALLRLDDAATRAVLAHEQHHAAHRDPLRLLVARAAVAALPHGRLLRPLLDRFEQAAEIAADAQAVAEQHHARPLARALLVFLDGHQGVASCRVDALSGQPLVRTPTRPLTWAALGAGVTLTVGAAVLAGADGHGPVELAALLLG